MAAYLRSLLSGFDGIELQDREPEIDRHANYMFVFKYAHEAFNGLSRDQFVRLLNAEGVPAFRMYPRVQDTSFYDSAMTGVRDLKATPCPVSRDIAERGVWIHHRVLLGTEDVVAQVAEAIAKIRAFCVDPADVGVAHDS
jgi:3-amino-5-hydroxybenzoate synthase